MKMGIRKPSIKKSISARTTGKLKRSVKKAVNPVYGKKGVGIITDPKKAIYNKVYNKTTISAIPPTISNKGNSKSKTKEYSKSRSDEKTNPETEHFVPITAPEPVTEKKDSNLKRVLQVVALATMVYGFVKFDFIWLLVSFIILTITNFIMK